MIDTQVIQKIKTTLWLLPVALCIDMQVDINYYKHDNLIHQIYFIMSLAISHHNIPCKQVRHPLICCCMFYVAAMGI
jgi:hypothetical protein